MKFTRKANLSQQIKTHLVNPERNIIGLNIPNKEATIPF